MVKVAEAGAEGVVMMPQMLEDRERGDKGTREQKNKGTRATKDGEGLAAGTRRRVGAYGLMQGNAGETLWPRCLM